MPYIDNLFRFRYNLGRSTKTLGPAKILRCMDDAYAFLIFNRKEMGKKGIRN